MKTRGKKRLVMIGIRRRGELGFKIKSQPGILEGLLSQTKNGNREQSPHKVNSDGLR